MKVSLSWLKEYLNLDNITTEELYNDFSLHISEVETMKQVSLVGSDLKFDDGIGTCGKAGQSVPVGIGQPTLKIDTITVGGTKA